MGQTPSIPSSPPNYPPPQPPQQKQGPPSFPSQVPSYRPKANTAVSAPRRPTTEWDVSDVTDRDRVTISSIFVTINPNKPQVSLDQFRPFIVAVASMGDKFIKFKGGREPVPSDLSKVWVDPPKIEYALEKGPERGLSHSHMLFTMRVYSKYGYVHVDRDAIKAQGLRHFGTPIYVQCKSVSEPIGLYNYLSKTRPGKSYVK